MAVNDVYEVTLQCVCSGGVRTANVQHFRMTGGSGSNLACINDLQSALAPFYVALAALMSQDITYDTLRIRRVGPTPSASFEFGLAGLTGGVTENMVPADHGVSVAWYSGDMTKKGRGRNRWPGLPVTEHQGGVLTSDVSDSFRIAFGLLLIDITGTAGNTYHLCIWNKTDAVPHDVTDRRVHSRLSPIRSRTEKSST